MYAESNVASGICHGLGICTLTYMYSIIDYVIHLYSDWSVAWQIPEVTLLSAYI